jgi:hypothetical protein
MKLPLLTLGTIVAAATTCNAAITKTVVPPTRVVWMSDSTGTYVANADNLISPFCGQVSVAGTQYTTLSSDSLHQGSVLLDFGRELHGGLKISAAIRPQMAPVHLRIRFGESVTEAMYDLNTPGNPLGGTNDHAVRDFTVAVPWLGSVECGNSGFRFVRIDMLDTDTPFALQNVSATLQIRDDAEIGSFSSSNQRLNNIWSTGAYTVKLNMQDYLWDGVKRDRLVWVGDMHPEVLTISNVWGAHEVVNKSLDFAVADTPLPGWMNGMCSYSLWWIIIQRDLYMYTGNDDYLRAQGKYLNQLVKQIAPCVGSDGIEHLDGAGRFLDWPTSEMSDVIHCGLQSMMLMAMDAARQIGAWIGDSETESIASDCLKRMAGVTLNNCGNSQAAALAVISGQSRDIDADCDLIVRNGADRFSTFYGYYMLEALAKGGRYQEAMDLISQYWGAMIDLGATTFWEDLNYNDVANAGRIDEIVPANRYDIHSGGGAYCYKGLRLSMCHGWASGPTAWLTRHILGVKPLQPGCRTIEVKPHLGNLDSVEGTFPTPLGVVTVKAHRTAKGTVECKVSAPKGIKVIK